jgi:HEAT repeat protein
MMLAPWTVFALPLVILAALFLAGCQGGGMHMPWDPPIVVLPGIKTTDQQITDIRKVGHEAAGKSRGEQEQIAQKFAEQIAKEDDPLVRVEIIRAIANCPVPITGAVLKGALEDSAVIVRIAATKAWAKRGGTEAAEALGHTATSDSQSDVRLAAAQALGQVSDPIAVRSLGEVVSDPDPAMQFTAVESLRKISGKDYGNDVKAWQQYAKGEKPQAAPVSLAERFKKMF